MCARDRRKSLKSRHFRRIFRARSETASLVVSQSPSSENATFCFILFGVLLSKLACAPKRLVILVNCNAHRNTHLQRRSYYQDKHWCHNLSSNVWEDIWKRSPRLHIRWYAEEFLHYLIGWSLTKQYSLFLEPGAGSGRFSYYLSKKGLEVVALDLSRSSVIAIRNLKQTRIGLLHVIRADILHMPFRDRAFDVVYNEGVVEHFPEPYRVLSEMVRVTRRLGIVIFSVPNVYSFHTLGKLMSSGSISISRPYGFEKSFSKNELKGMLQFLRLKSIEVHGIGLFYGVARYMPFPIYTTLYRMYAKLKSTKLGIFLTEFAGFHIIGKGEKG